MTRAEKSNETRRRHKESKERIAKAHAETETVVRSGVCPLCGSALRRNLSLTGWWTCEQRGAPGFRRDASKPACEWQGFTS